MYSYTIVPITRCIHIYVVSYILCFVAVSVSFNQSTYTINESDRVVRPVLILSKSVTTNVTVRVDNSDNTASGKYAKSINNILYY